MSTTQGVTKHVDQTIGTSQRQLVAINLYLPQQAEQLAGTAEQLKLPVSRFQLDADIAVASPLRSQPIRTPTLLRRSA